MSIMAERKVGIVYLLVFPDGKKYVGATFATLESRLKSHRRDAKRPKHPVNHAWASAVPKVSVLSEMPQTKEELYAKEISAIERHGTLWPEGYNRTRGGNHTFTETEEGRVLISRVMQGNNWGIGNKNASGKRTEEQRARMSAAWVNRWTAEARAKVSATLRAQRARRESGEPLADNGKGKSESANADGKSTN